MAPDVLVVGALHLDVIVTAARLPVRDETLIGSAVAYAFGGKGGNQAVAAARMGARAAMAGRVGDDAFAATVLAALDVGGVNRSRVQSVKGATGMSAAMLDANGDYAAVVVSGVNAGIRAEEIDLPAGLPVLILQNEIPDRVNASLVARLGAETRLIFNAAPARAVAQAILKRCNILIVNRVEAAMLTGQDSETLDSATAARVLKEQGPGVVIVTLGGDGVVADSFAAPAHRVAVLSTHGAGDAFTGALAARIAAGDGPETACRFAQAAAALHVSNPPERRAGITKADVRQLMA